MSIRSGLVQLGVFAILLGLPLPPTVAAETWWLATVTVSMPTPNAQYLGSA